MKKNETYHESGKQDTPGKKLQCVFLHGWGMNKAVWCPLMESLPPWLEAIAIDLPGHGEHSDESFSDLSQLVEITQSVVNEPALWVGWSLGGLVVAQLALDYPEKVAAMLLVSSSPCFVKRDDWSLGMDTAVFDEFAAELEKDFTATIQRFLSLQVRGSESGRQLLRRLRKDVLEQPAANPAALRAGLHILKTVDLRRLMSSCDVSGQWILGGRDNLVNVAQKQILQELLPDFQFNVIPEAGHAPFLSHQDEFRKQLISFARQVYESL